MSGEGKSLSPINVLFQHVINDHGNNLVRNWNAVVAEYGTPDATAKAAAPSTRPELMRLIAVLRGDIDTYRESRDAVANLVSNSLATVAGLATVYVSGGLATPLVVAWSAAAGSATQALMRMGLTGYFDVEELTADLVLGAVNAGTVALSLPGVTREALAAGTAKIGVLRQVAGSAFAGGASAMGLATAFNETTWANGFAPGLLNVLQASALGGLGSAALAGMAGAAVHLVRSSPIGAALRNFFAEEAGTVVLDPALWKLIRDARAASQTMEECLELLQGSAIGAQVNTLANRLAATAGQGATEVRAALREALTTLDPALSQTHREMLVDVALTAREKVGQGLANMTAAEVRAAVVEGLEEAVKSHTAAVTALSQRLTAAGVANPSEQEVAGLMKDFASHQATNPLTPDQVQALVLSRFGHTLTDKVADDLLWCVTEAPAGLTTFTNLFPNHAVEIPRQVFSPEQVKRMAGRTLNYVVTENGELIIGRIDSRFGVGAGGGHIDLARGRPVRAAGEVVIRDGKIKFLDNASGHYEPKGLSAQKSAEYAFKKAGFEVEGKYIEKYYHPERGWIPVGEQ